MREHNYCEILGINIDILVCILNEGYGWHDLNQTEVLAVRAAIKVNSYPIPYLRPFEIESNKKKFILLF